MSYQKRTKSSLEGYKRQALGVAEDGIWRRNQKSYPHILPLDKRQLNILSPIRQDFWRWFEGRGIRLHSDFHHLNSSQALCFNLFFPLLTGGEEAIKKVLDALQITAEPQPGATFEFQPDNVEGTSFDFMIPLVAGARVYFEVKYTERAFGKAPIDGHHIDKFQRVYTPRLKGRFHESFCSEAGFLANYQIARNIWHLNDKSEDLAVFLFPSANKSLRKHESVIRCCAIEPFRSRVRIVYLEDLLAILQQDPRSTSLERASLAEFQSKYFPSAP